ncbi:grainyhead-like protein 1 homolog isoform 2 [Lichtheimia corymbifera JMRC:FSU:9682]|uniref:Grainyhead-like protein 1 homolog isoform 2 n=1 Tax=Lichtheimia corymbifera JMRC:FSU:9682 TaxID=1263082 RepID=A0A068RLJ7_9FUNG|nr:grainyhead-like protein 1 homolog isoform 2 [Lichtheimia corymbifera JMRC:FSU:9682]
MILAHQTGYSPCSPQETTVSNEINSGSMAFHNYNNNNNNNNQVAPPSSSMVMDTSSVAASTTPMMYNSYQPRQRTASSGGFPTGIPTMYNPTNSVYYYDDMVPAMPLHHHHHQQPAFFSEEQRSHQQHSPTPSLMFHAILQAISQKTEDLATTYLNRGQWYVIELRDTRQQEGATTVTSTVAIMFHEPSHRRVADNYWKFWLTQQKEPHQARAIDLDDVKSMGISNVQYPAFDRITFDWQGSARIYVCFNCLSTDFSRIKGVKGIPLRISLQNYTARYQHYERSLCKIKLFRDKGAERKSKDDAKQMGKQIERMPGSHIMYNQPMPYSPFTVDAMPHINEPPVLPQQRLSDHPVAAADTALMAFQRHSRTMTAPPSMHPHQYQQHHVDPPMSASSSVSPSTSPPAMLLEKSWPDLAHDFLSYQAVAPPPPHPSSPSALTTSTSTAADVHSSAVYPLTTSTPQKYIHPSPSTPTFMNDTTKRQHQPVRTLYVQVSKDASFKPVELQEMTAQELTFRLCKAMSLCTDSVSEVVWRRKEGNQLLVLVDDAVVNYQFYDNLKLLAGYQLKSDGTARIILDY